jgi:hypothetical protein
VIFHRVRRLTLAGFAVVLAAGTAVITPAVSSAQPACPDVEIVFARGTSEPAGIGRVGQALADALAPQLGGRSLGTYGVNYPAGYDFLTTADGANDAAAHITTMAQQCPATRIVLGGYSRCAAPRQQDWRDRIGAATASGIRRERRRSRGIRQSRNEVREPADSAGVVRGQVNRPVQRRRPDLLGRPQPIRPHALRILCFHRSGGRLRGRTGLAPAIN